MGSKLTKEQGFIYNCFSASKYPDKKWKEFLFKFETKFFDEDEKDFKFKIDYDKFELIFFSRIKKEISENEETVENFTLFHTLQTMFKRHEINDLMSVRVYRIYILFFPFLYHTDNTKYLDLLELIFGNVEFFLLREIEQRYSDLIPQYTNQHKKSQIEIPVNEDLEVNTNIPKQYLYDNKDDLKLLYLYGSLSDIPEVRKKTEKLKLYEFLRGENYVDEIPLTKNIQNEVINQAKLKKIHFLTFYQLIYVFFDTIVIGLINDFTVFLERIHEENVNKSNQIQNEKSREVLKNDLKIENIKIEEFRNKDKIKDFLDSTFKKLRVRKSITLQIINGLQFEDLYLTMEDVRYYFKTNKDFFNPLNLLETFLMNKT